MKIYYCNAQSLVKKIDQLNCVAAELEPDIILITETWCHENISDAFLKIDGYELVNDLRTDRADTAHGRGGGLVVFIRPSFKVFKIDALIDFNQYCIFKLETLTIYLVYRSPSAPPNAIDGLISMVRGAPQDSIIIGDFNIPEVDWITGAAPARYRGLVDAIEECNMTQLIDFPTQVSGNILDLVITNIPERISELFQGDRLAGSDHMAIHVTVNLAVQKRLVKRTLLNWHKADVTGIEEHLTSLDWGSLFRDCTAEEKWAVFRDSLLAAVNKFVPEKPASPPGRPPWMSREIAAALKRKQNIWRRTRHLGKTEEYRTADKEVKNLIRRSKRSYEKRLAADGRANKRRFYAYVKNKTKCRTTVGPLKDENGRKVTSDTDMAAILNSFFCSVFTRDQGGAAPVAACRAAVEIREVTINAAKVEAVIDQLKPASAPGPDGIGPGLLLKLKKVVSPILADIFNTSLNDGIVPEDWRRANVTPIYKKGAKSDPSNYRPVSLT